MVTDTWDCQFAGFAADGSSLHTVWNRKSRIRHSLVDSGHDLAPDIFMIRSTLCVGTEFLVQVISGPDTCCIIREESHKPDIVVASGSTTFLPAQDIFSNLARVLVEPGLAPGLANFRLPIMESFRASVRRKAVNPLIPVWSLVRC